MADAEVISTAVPAVKCKCCGHDEGEGPLGCEACGYGLKALETAELVIQMLVERGYVIAAEPGPGECAPIDDPEDEAEALAAICSAIADRPKMTFGQRIEKIELELLEVGQNVQALVDRARKADYQEGAAGGERE